MCQIEIKVKDEKMHKFQNILKYFKISMSLFPKNPLNI